MNVYQMIRHEYVDDDGHYTAEPLDNTVFADEITATEERDALNESSVFSHNQRMESLIAEYKENGWGINHRYMALFLVHHTDIDALERFANRENGLTFYTIEELVVV